jgi:uncharacterized Zn finger protein (UPF0148 family)
VKCAEPTCSKELYLWTWSRSAPQSALPGATGKCPEHGRWVWCKRHMKTYPSCPVCWANATKRVEEAEEKERRRREEAEAARQKEIAEVPLEERARRAAEQQKQEQVARWQARLRELGDDITPRAIAIVQRELGVTTSPDDWTLNAAAAFDFDREKEFVTLELDGIGIRVRRRWDRVDRGNDYHSDWVYDGWVWNRAKQEFEQLSLATFGEIQQANKAAERAEQERRHREETEAARQETLRKEQGKSGPDITSLRDMWAFLAAIEEGDTEAMAAIWDHGDHLRMMGQAVGQIAVWIREAGHEPVQYARRAIARIGEDEASGKVS